MYTNSIYKFIKSTNDNFINSFVIVKQSGKSNDDLRKTLTDIYHVFIKNKTELELDTNLYNFIYKSLNYANKCISHSENINIFNIEVYKKEFNIITLNYKKYEILEHSEKMINKLLNFFKTKDIKSVSICNLDKNYNREVKKIYYNYLDARIKLCRDSNNCALLQFINTLFRGINTKNINEKYLIVELQIIQDLKKSCITYAD